MVTVEQSTWQIALLWIKSSAFSSRSGVLPAVHSIEKWISCNCLIHSKAALGIS